MSSSAVHLNKMTSPSSHGVDFEKASLVWKQLKRDFRQFIGLEEGKGRGVGGCGGTLPSSSATGKSSVDDDLQRSPSSTSVSSLLTVREHQRRLSADGMPHLLFDWFVDSSRRSIRRRIVPDFWRAFPDEEDDEGVAFGRHSLPAPFEKNCLLLLHDAVDKMHAEMKPILAGAKLVDDLAASRTHRGCETLLLETLLGVVTTRPKLTLFPVVRCAYRLAFKAFQRLRTKGEKRTATTAGGAVCFSFTVLLSLSLVLVFMTVS